MPPERVNRESVERRRDRLQAEWGETRVHEEREEVPADLFEELLDESRSGYTGGGYAWVVRDPGDAAPLTESMPDEIDEDRRALMILGRDGSRWGLPGGGREDGETYEEAAVREVREEVGIDCTITDLFLLRHRVTVSAGDHDERLHTLWAFFDAAYEGGAVEIQPGELNGAAWFADPPARLHPENAYRAAEFWDGFEADDPLAERGE
ncbi:MAG: NUDIX hydrolase [Haloarculaceae archaeon]